MSILLPKTLVGRAALIEFLNGTLGAEGRPSASTGCTTASGEATVTGPAGVFAEVQVGDRFHVSGVAVERTVATKTNDQSIELNDTIPVTIGGDGGTWRAYRGTAVDPDDIVQFDVNQDAAPTYHLIFRTSTFG